MDDLALQDLQRRMNEIERLMPTFRGGKVTSVTPLEVTLGGSAIPFPVNQIVTPIPLEVDACVRVVVTGNDAVVIGEVGDAPAPSTAGVIETGMIMLWPTGAAPDGWLFADGGSYSTADYPDLFGLIGYDFGGSGGSFLVPHFGGRFAIGPGGGRSLGDTGGEEEHTLALGEIPAHRHSAPGTVTAGSSGFTFMVSNVGPGSSIDTDYSLLDAGGSSAGGGAPHNNMPPWIAVPYIIKT